MTIVTKPFTEKVSKQQKQPLVEHVDVDETRASAPALTPDRLPRGSLLVTVTRSGRDRTRLQRARAGRAHSLATLAVFVMSAFVFAIGLLGATYLYREYNQYKASGPDKQSVKCEVPSACDVIRRRASKLLLGSRANQCALFVHIIGRHGRQ